MKDTILLWVAALLIACNAAPSDKNAAVDSEADPWAKAKAITASIVKPEFPDADFDITAFGAIADSTTDILPAVRKAIDSCHAAGGGRVLVPAGTYYCGGPIHLKSNVNFHLAEGSTIKFSTDPADYLPVVMTRWEGVECYNYSPLIYALDQENIAITGKGTLDGQASNENWWSWCGKDYYGWKEGMPNQADDPSRPTLFGWNTQEVPVEERKLGEGAFLRPNFLQPYRCKNVLIEGVTIRNSPMWIIHPVLSENVTVDGVKVISHGPNSDGCDPECCKNVWIKNCYFDTGDDCIALKSGRNQDGRRIGRPIENVVVQNCEMKDGHGGVVIGSEVSGGARYIFAENCTMDSPNLDRALRIKTNKVRGGTVEHIYFRNSTVGEVREAVVRVNMRYPIYSDTNQTYIPVIHDIYVDNVTSQKSRYGLLIDGYSVTHPVKDVHLKNCNFSGVEQGNSIEFGENLVFENCLLNGEPMNAPAQ